MTDGEGDGWYQQEPVADDAPAGDAQGMDAAYSGYHGPAAAPAEGGGPSIIQAQFAATIASHAYTDAEIATLLQAGLPASVAGLVDDAGQGGDAVV